tara:strand:- start:5164 stop:10527 length:5364 start_codon:yes stop_codon:yes gene_type:complete
MADKNNINFSSVLPLGAEFTNTPETIDLDFSSALERTSQDKFSLEKILLSGQTAQAQAKRAERYKEQRQEFRDNLREVAQQILPERALDIYNESTEGTALAALRGEPVFQTKKSAGLPTSLFYDFTVSLGSLFGSPTDLGLLFTGGKIGQGLYKFGGKQLIDAGSNFLVKKNILNAGFKSVVDKDIGEYGFKFAGAFGARDPFYQGALEMADRVAVVARQKELPKSEIIISDSDTPLITYPGYSSQVSLLEQEAYNKKVRDNKNNSLKGKVGPINLKEEKKGVPLDIAFTIERENDYFLTGKGIRDGKPPSYVQKTMDKINRYENSDDKYIVALSEVMNNTELSDALSASGLITAMSGARLWSKYLPKVPFRKDVSPLSAPRGFATTTGAEVSTAMLAHPLFYGEGYPDTFDIAAAAGVVMASRLPGFLGKRAQKFAKQYKERPRTGPMSEAMKRKVAEAEEAEVIDINKIKKKGKNLELELKSSETKPIVVGSMETLSKEELGIILKYSRLGEAKNRRINDIYELVQDPITAVRDASKLKLGTPIFERTKDGEIIFVGESVSDSDQIIRTLNRSDLPGGFAVGDYVDQPIIGKMKGFVIKKQKGDKTRETLRAFEQNVEIPLGVNAKIIRDSIKPVGDDLAFDVQIGRTVYQLDPKNADLFLKHYTSQPLLKYKFEHNNKGVMSKPFALTKIRRKVLRALYRDEANPNLQYSLEGDYRQAIAVIASDLKYKKLLNALSATKDKATEAYKKPIKIRDLSDIEMKLITERIQDVRNIRRSIDFVVERLEGSNLRFVNPITKDNEIINVGATIMSELGNQLTSPAAKTLGGLVSAVDRSIVGYVTNDLVDLQLALGMDKEVISLKKIAPTFLSKAAGYNPFRNELAEKWITGSKDNILSDGVLYRGFDDYLKLDANPKELGKFKAKLKKIKANREKYPYSDKEVNFLEFRIKAIENIKRLTDSIKDRALAAGIQMPGVKDYYMPFVMEKKYRDTIYSSMKDLNDKVSDIMGVSVLSRNKDDLINNLDEAQIKELKKEISDWIEGLNRSKDKYKQGTASAWSATLEKLQEVPGNVGRVPELDVWLALNTALFNDGFKRYGHLEKKRTLGKTSVTDVDVTAALMRKKIDLLDNNLATLFTDYILGANKRIELVRTFGLDGKLFDRLLKLIPEDDALQGPIPSLIDLNEKLGIGLLERDPRLRENVPPDYIKTQRDAMRVVRDVLTGESQYNRSNQLSKIFELAAQIVFSTKISLSTAIVQNMFQPFISFVPDLGIWSSGRGSLNYFIDPKVGDKILRAGPTQLSLVDDLIPGVRALRLSTTRIVSPKDSYVARAMDQVNMANITQALGQPFMFVNLGNKVFAAAAADDYIKKMAKLLTGDQNLGDKAELFFGLLTVKDKKQYARNKLSYRFGLDPDEVIKYAPQIISDTFGSSKAEQAFARKYRRALENYAQLSQAGREFMLDSFSQNDPNARQINLFKRWAKRQLFLMNDIYEFEMANGNYLIPATMAASGVFAGYMSARGLEILKDFAAGEEDIRDEKYQRNLSYRPRMPKIKDVFKGDDRFYMEDLKNAMITGGLFGMAGDIVLGDENFDALTFAVSPAGWQDLQRVGNLFYELAIKGPITPGADWNAMFRKELRQFGPFFGSLPNLRYIRQVAYQPWEGPAGKVFGSRFEDVTGRRDTIPVPVQDDIARIKRIRSNIVSEVIDLGLDLDITGKKSLERQISDKIEEWNNSADANRYWDGRGLNPYAIYFERDILESGKIQERWVEKMNKNREKYELKPSDIMRDSRK